MHRREPGGRDLPARKSERTEEAVEVPDRSDVATDVPVFTPPFLGARVAKGEAYDQQIGEGNAEGNATVQAAIDALVDQTRSIERAVAALKLEDIAFEGSESLDAPDKVFQ